MSTSVIGASLPVADAKHTALLAKADPRAKNSATNVYRFATLIAQLALLLTVFRVYHVEQFKGPDDLIFFSMCCVAFAAFAIHYWLPFHLKEKFWIAVSICSAALFLQRRVALALFLSGALFYLVVSSRLSYRIRVGIVTAGLGLAMLCSWKAAWMEHLRFGLSLPRAFWPVFGAIFMFRLVVYLYDLQTVKGKPSLTEFLAYFFILPNYFFLLFPVIDFKTMRLSYYRRDIHEVAQRGIFWICRGTVQILLYMVVYFSRDLLAFNGMHSLGSVAAAMLLTFLLYLRVSGQFHIAIGLLLLFGYDLPETNHKYLLSSSLNDFWRRINIYWKDFMVKIVYFPTYFRLRKKNEFRARMIATAMVFFVTWALHAYQSFWLNGHASFSWPDTIFWAALGSLVMLNVWWEIRHPRRKKLSGIQGFLRNAASVLVTMAVILFLWSLWSSPSVQAWGDFLTYWKPKS